MKMSYRKLVSMMSALALAMITVPIAQAQCGGLPGKLVKPSSWNPSLTAPRIMKASLGNDPDQDSQPSIVGMWHVVFTGQTLDKGPYTLPQPLDDSLAVWHSDGTEIMNSSRPAQDGNFCLGVWKQTGDRRYYVNHLPWHANTPDNAPGGIGYPTDGAQLLEQIVLSPDGNHYSGTFTEVLYDTSGNVAATFTGTLAATRITISTPFSSLL